ncbi:MAG TPA: FAD-binding oxidoreductase [Anaerolineales bacterium]|nr:FAD-binding oxidoreductase [Anaerolineales bacterium]
MLNSNHLELSSAWGLTYQALNYVHRPSTVEGIRQVFTLAKENGRTVGLRGSGRSYGDAAVNAEQILLELTRMTRILDWNPETGKLTVEPGVTIRDIWRYIIGDGWWLPVVPGTAFPTIGGALGMNLHGKNQYKAGTLGEHVLEFTALLSTGELLHCSPEKNPEFFYAMIGSFGVLGVFTSITLQMKRIYSGQMHISTHATANLQDLLNTMEQRKASSDYLIGWIDCFAKGQALGRGQLQIAHEFTPGEDPNPQRTLSVQFQEPPEELFGIVPRSILWRFIKYFVNPLGMRLTSLGNYLMGLLKNDKQGLESYVSANFLLDYFPRWKETYLPGGLIQHQSFIPAEHAYAGFREILQTCHDYGLPAYLAVVKRYRPDPFLISYSVDGFSMALDFHVTRRNRQRLQEMVAHLDEIVLKHHGRFYMAKDATLYPHTVSTFLGETTLAQLTALKSKYDPQNLLQTNLSRRLFPQIHITTPNAQIESN